MPLKPFFMYAPISAVARVHLYAALHKQFTQDGTYRIFEILLGELAAQSRHCARHIDNLQGEGTMYSVQLFGVTVFLVANASVAENVAASLGHELSLFARTAHRINLTVTPFDESFVTIMPKMEDSQ